MLQCRAIELWRPAVGFDDFFRVSNCGGVRSESGPVPLQVNPRGYRHVSLGGVRRSVHSLVLEAFVEPRPPGMLGLHWDDNPANNCVSSLRWGSHAENMRDAIRNGRRRGAYAKTHCKRGHPLAGDNLTESALPAQRLCKACNRARAHLRWKHPEGFSEAMMCELAEEFFQSSLVALRLAGAAG